MKRFVIMADATCDLGESLREQYDIVVVPTHILLPDGRDIPSFHEWKEFSREQFYADLKANPDGFTTAPPNVAEFEKVFEPYAEKGEDILLLTISTGIIPPGKSPVYCQSISGNCHGTISCRISHVWVSRKPPHQNNLIHCHFLHSSKLSVFIPTFVLYVCI